MGSPEKAISLSRLKGMRFMKVSSPVTLYGTESLAGVMARVTSGAAMMRSQLRANSQAPPQTLPSTRAMTGEGKSSMRRTSMRSESLHPRGSRPPRGSSFTSCPADHTFAPACARKMTARVLACSITSRAPMRSCTIAAESALRRSM